MINKLKQKLKDLIKRLDKMSDTEIYKEVHSIDGFARHFFKWTEEERKAFSKKGNDKKKLMKKLADNDQIKKYEKV